MPTSGETNSAGFFGSASQSNLQSLGHINILGSSRGLNIHDMTMDQPSAQYDDQKKAKLEVSMGFAQSTSNGAAAEAATESFNNQSEHGSATASNWHQAHHHAQAYTNAQYPSQYFTQVQMYCHALSICLRTLLYLSCQFHLQVLLIFILLLRNCSIFILLCRALMHGNKRYLSRFGRVSS